MRIHPWVAAAGVCLPGAGLAQSEGAGNAAALEEVVVTAQKREQSAQSVPISIQAFSESALEQLGAASLQDLERAAAGVSFGDGSAFGRAGVRGVIDHSRNAGYDARVGVYIDGVFMGRSYMNNVSLLDVDHVEVLRGPQGTLFGKNSDAGAINIVTRKPDGDFTGSVLAEAGNFGFRRVDGYLSGPLSGDVLAASIAVSKAESDGYYRNTVLQKDVNGIDHFSARAQLRYRPSEAWDINLSVDTQDYDDTIVHNPADVAPGADPFVYNSLIDDTEGHKTDGVTLTAQYRTAGDYVITNIADYREASSFLYFGGQGNIDRFIIGDYHDSVTQFSEELRLASPKHDRFDYVAGLYYFNMRDDQDNLLRGGEDLARLGGPFVQYVGAELPSLANVDSQSYAAYINGNYRITPQLELNAGLRYTRDRKELEFSMLDPFQVILGNVSGLRDKRTDTDVSPKVGLNYHVSDDVLLYASYAEGFKSGGWNADYVTNNQIAAGLEVEPEYARSYEIGFKSQFWNRRARLNVVAFHSNFTDFQVFQLTLRQVGNSMVQQTSLTNAGEVTSKGVEIETALAPLDGLTVSLNGTYNDSQFDVFPGGGGAFQGQILDADGVQTPYAPKYKGYLAVDGDYPLGTWGSLLLHLGYAAQSDQNGDAKVVNPNIGYIYEMDGYGMLDARIGIGSPDRRWQVDLWGRNLTDDEHVIFTIGPTIGTGRLAKYDTPRTYGVTLSAKF